MPYGGGIFSVEKQKGLYLCFIYCNSIDSGKTFQDIILVEGLKLDDVQPGLYSVHCLPLRLVGAEGSPIRCILIK